MSSSTSTLDYVNNQLVAHGFAPSPGLCLEGASNDNSARVIECLLGLLGQRVVRHQLMQRFDCYLIYIKHDMSSMEDLTVKCRTLTYDLERMWSLHGKEVEKAVNAERETNLHKSRLAYVPSFIVYFRFV